MNHRTVADMIPGQDLTIQLRDAIRSGDVKGVKNSLENGASTNQPIDGELPLTFAIRNGEEDVAIFLIESGADITLELIQSDGDSDIPRVNGTTSDVPEGASYKAMEAMGHLYVSDWIQQMVFDMLWMLSVRSSLLPPSWRARLPTIFINTLFGFYMRIVVSETFKAVWNKTLSTCVRNTLKLSITYLVMFALAQRRTSTDHGMPKSLSNWCFWHALALLYRAPLFRLQGLLITVGQGIIRQGLSKLYSSIKDKTSRAKLHGGNSALEAILANKGDCERVALALLEHGLFSPDYVEESLWKYLHYSDSPTARVAQQCLVRKLWSWSLDRGNDQIVAKLLELGVSPSQPTPHGRPLSYAASRGHEDIVDILLKGNLPQEEIDEALVASAGKLDKCLHHNPGRSDNRVFDSLLERSEDVNHYSKSFGGLALTCAVSNGNVHAVEALLKRKANVNKTDTSGKAPLLALRSDETAASILKMLLNAGANINHQDDDGCNILLWHARLSNTEIVRLLLVHGADPSRRRNDGFTAMQLAARYCMTDMIQELLNAGAHVDDASESANSPLLLACHCHWERADALRLLVEKGANPNVVDHDGKTPLHLVCDIYSSSKFNGRDDHLESIRILIKAGVDVNRTYNVKLKGNTEIGTTALGIMASATYSGTKYRALKILLDAGASPEAFGSELNDGHYRLAIVGACRDGPSADSTAYNNEEDCVELLLQKGANLHHCDESQMGLWHHAADGKNFQAARSLSQRGLDANSRDVHGRTALHLACQDRYWTTMEGHRKWTAAGRYVGSEAYANWHCSIESSLTILGLFAADANANLQDKFGATPAHIAAKAGNPRVLSMLLLYAGVHQTYDYADNWDRLPLHHAANSSEATRVLLHYHLQQTVESDRYFQILEPPSESLHAIAVKSIGIAWDKILKRRYQEAHPNEAIPDNALVPPWRNDIVNTRDKCGNTPLHYAAMLGNIDVVRQYLKLDDVDLSLVNEHGQTAYELAAIVSRACALVIADKLAQLGLEVPEVDDRVQSDLRSLWHKHAKRFVQALQEEYRYGAYPLEK
ncbi:ankyrin repeat-containing domain protein [Xylariaceae sp. FL1651]|nr:ankyrin repeat-containing domain protein [Xylariaceae sp. FL1651]